MGSIAHGRGSAEPSSAVIAVPVVAFVAVRVGAYQLLIVKSLAIVPCASGEYRGHRQRAFFRIDAQC
jgi:hypothetical protein